MIEMARERDLSIMLGCMIESSIGITAAAHLSPLVDHADLDGHLLIDNDPYIGVRIEDGRVMIPDHLSPLVDHADLDGHLLIDNDPYIGVRIEDGRVVIPDGLGLGIELDSDQPGLK